MKYTTLGKTGIEVSKEDVAFLEEPYRAHEIVGALSKTDPNTI